jgi:uncharacterized repeat protein (TIGR03803 family)
VEKLNDMNTPKATTVLASASVFVAASLQAWEPEILYGFNTEPANPVGRLAQDNDGNFYGMTAVGVGQLHVFGTIFRLTPDGVLTTLVDFDGFNGDGQLGQSGLVLASDGNFYGTTFHGGSGDQWTTDHGYPGDNGTVFRLTPADGLFTTLVKFSVTNGSGPNELALGRDGSFYGTSMWGGSNNLGTVFRVTTNGVLTTLFSFKDYIRGDGANPAAGLVLGSDSNFYGTTSQGGNYGFGTVFQFSAAGGLRKLADFDHRNGATPMAEMVLGNDGALYGTTENGGSEIGERGYGTVFQITTNGTFGWSISLTSTTSWTPQAGLVLGRDGNFYGTTFGDNSPGSTNLGTVFQVTPQGVLTTLVRFAGTNGAHPAGGLILGRDGNLYGATFSGGPGGGGTIFRLATARLSSIAKQAGGSFSITGHGPPGVSYHLWAGTDLLLPLKTWMVLTNGSFGGDGESSYTDANATTNGTRFYRISVP